MSDDRITLPKYLSAASKRKIRRYYSEYLMEEHHLDRLIMLGGCWDKISEGEATLKAEGCYFTDSKGYRRPHPAIAVVRDNTVLAVRILRELNLAEQTDEVRPPKLRYGGKG